MLNTSINEQKLSELGGSHVKVNREYLLRKGVAGDLNTYLGWNPFSVFGDVMTKAELEKSYNDENYDPSVGAPGIKSIFNRYGAVLLGAGDKDVTKISAFRLSNNVPLIDTPENRKLMRSHSNCTIRELVDASATGMLGKATYAYSDFMYCKYLGTMPNNYLITLRRFPMPVDDYISAMGDSSSLRNETSSENSLSTGTMVTWLNTPGNDMESILSYSLKMPFEQKQAQWENSGIDADSNSKPLNALAATFDSKYRAQVASGKAMGAIEPYMSKILGAGIEAPYHGLLSWRDDNKVYGPIYAVKKTYKPSEEGIDFEQTFKLTFEYELRSYNGINGKQAMLDLISNILQVTYTTGTFWGGGYRGSGAHQNNLFANLKIMNTSGGFTDFVDSFFQDASNIINTKFGGQKFSWQNLGKSVLNFFNNLGGMLAGGLLNKLGRPQKAMVNSLLSPAPVGLWHVTIGNPFHPIMTMGNMILKNATITHSGPLGIDDFPTNLKVECELERGKPRDLRGVEMLYMNGNDRIYYPMGDKTAEMYKHAKKYKSDTDMSAYAARISAGLGAVSKTISKNVGKKDNNSVIPSIKTNIKDSLNTLMRYFGVDDASSINFTSKEQEYGSQPKKKGKKATDVTQ